MSIRAARHTQRAQARCLFQQQRVGSRRLFDRLDVAWSAAAAHALANHYRWTRFRWRRGNHRSFQHHQFVAGAVVRSEIITCKQRTDDEKQMTKINFIQLWRDDLLAVYDVSPAPQYPPFVTKIPGVARSQAISAFWPLG